MFPVAKMQGKKLYYMTLRAVKPIDAAPSSRTANIWV